VVVQGGDRGLRLLADVEEAEGVDHGVQVDSTLRVPTMKVSAESS
jgi:hypothetical protein